MLTPSADTALLAKFWRRWSPRRTVRVDRDAVHEYRSAPWPSGTGAPFAAPTACYLAGRDDKYRLLAFDFDAPKFGADAAATDSAILARVLDGLDVPYLVVRSGPAGGVHVWVRLDSAGVDAAAVDQLARALAAHLPTLDVSPLTNADTGCVRIPGAPHRHGGHAVPTVRGDELAAILQAMDRRPAPVELVDWLHARFPTRDRETAAPPTLNIVGAGAGAHVDRVRTDLSAATCALLTTPIPAGADRSSVAWRVLLGMAASGWAWRDVLAQLHEPGLVRVREDYDRAEAHAINQWHKALRIAAESAWPRTTEDRPADDQITVQLAGALSAAAIGARWARPGGASDERVLFAFVALCEQAHAVTINVDVRRLAESANVDASTVSRSLRRLAVEGWVRLQAVSEGTAAASWTLLDPPPCIAATQVETRPPSTRLPHAGHDVWVWRYGLGGVAERVHYYWSTGTPRDQIPAVTGYSTRTVSRWLDVLRSLGLLSPHSRLDRVASILGSSGVMVTRARRHSAERMVFDWWRAELAWRCTPGKRRRRVGPTPDGAAIALPIAAPVRARLGRFPTKAGGKMDWRAALVTLCASVEATA
ncbi:hypothetical protein HNP11_004153 [Tsukamurella ocularis]|uniref:hypothetical protein n=1 Tax=Tsukamurella ocularis TaxID=1970234 RepID=UPI0021675B5C|nr:hypothetical protein [Tsukamurella ocularis]MCS3789955.1 hypothetical protein [Tsukamurella ocularis]